MVSVKYIEYLHLKCLQIGNSANIYQKVERQTNDNTHVMEYYTTIKYWYTIQYDASLNNYS